MDAKSKCHSPSLVNFLKMRNFFQNDYSTKKKTKKETFLYCHWLTKTKTKQITAYFEISLPLFFLRFFIGKIILTMEQGEETCEVFKWIERILLTKAFYKKGTTFFNTSSLKRDKSNQSNLTNFLFFLSLELIICNQTGEGKL